ncbi:MAG TPA: hypothetical protein VGL77_02700 [Armatimonadota bacterium]
MSSTVSIYGHVLAAMLCFAAEPKNYFTQPVLSDVLMEITPESLRLVATDTHVLGVLHLTAMNSYGMDVACVEPVSLILPVNALKPLISDKRDPMLCLTIDGLQVTASNTSGVCIPVMGRDAAEYPDYHRVIPGQASQAITGFSVDAALVARFSAFAKALREEPKLSLRFHAETRVISVYLKNLSSFYGLLAPHKDDGPTALPAWLTPAEPHVIRLHAFDGFSGLDEEGKTWTMFTRDEQTERTPGPCAICRQVITTGWLCLDDGKAACNTHITMPVAELVNSGSTAIPGEEVPITHQ